VRAATWLLVSVGLLASCARGDGPRRAADRARVEQAEAAACLGRGDYACALARLRAAVALVPGDAVLWNQLGVAARLRFYQTGEDDYRDQELDALKRALKLDARSVDVLVNLGTTCWELGLRKEAAQAYGKAISLRPDHPDVLLMRERMSRSKQEVEADDEE
jgi:Flp pilus assembly protein TadD